MNCVQNFILQAIILFGFVVIGYSIEAPLSEGWTITNHNQSIEIHNEEIPSGVYSALERANITDSVLNSYNDINLRWIGKENWKYSLNFDVAEEVLNHSQIVLVFHGLDTIANITINNHELLPSPNNMFTRYRYNVRDKLITENNQLEIQFQSPIETAKQYAMDNNFTPPECPPARYNGECHMNMLRKMQASFSWDWGLAAPSVGIWKPVVLEVYDTAIIRDVTYALKSLDDIWTIDMTVYLESGVGTESVRSFEGYLFIQLIDVPEVPSIEQHVIVSKSKLDEFKVTVSMDVPKNLVDLWWPNGFGNQTLYRLNVTWLGENRDIFTNEIKQIPIEYLRSEKVIRIGFRTIDLIEDPANNGGNLFYFKVNDVPIFMKGTNLIPIDILPERQFNKEKIEYLVLSTKEAHMNAIRVWGGGVYESDYFYDLADEHGILIWQDMMFACAMYPTHSTFLESVEVEIAQNVRRLQRHPSILVWAGNNENEAALVQNWYGTRKEQPRFIREYIKLYKDVMEKAVRDNDQWHIWLYSSPSNGNQSQTVVNENPQDNNYGDIHYYNYILDAWNSNIFPKARFISEYGFQSIPSMHSLKQTMYTTDKIDDIIGHRQHFPFGNVPIINLMTFNLPMPKIDANYWNTFIYFSQISQAMATKIETETYRVGRFYDQNTMGALYWQLNDVWTAPSWSSIEHNGNFKLLHYWAKEFFAPIHVVANLDALNTVNVFVIRDSLGKHQEITVNMRVFTWSSLNPVLQYKFDETIGPNTVQRIVQNKLGEILDGKVTTLNSFLHFTVEDNESGEILATNFLLLNKLKRSKLIMNPQLQYTIANSHCDAKDNVHSADIEISVSAPAIFVYVQVKSPQIETYKLSKNGFIQLTSKDLVTISFYNRNCAMAFTNDDIQILTVNDYLTT